MSSHAPTEVLAFAGRRAGALIAGRYRLAAHLGAGSTADVWRAYDESRDRPVTLKILRDREDADTRRRFLDEARRLETLDHPAFVPILGLQDSLGITLIAYEPVEGEPLDRSVATRGPLSARRVALLLLQLAGAVDALHTHGFVHLDLKPANILIGIDGRARLLDFGIAEPIGHSPEVPRGTPGYAAPEVSAGAVTSRASDVFGLAAIANEILDKRSATPRLLDVLRHGLEAEPARRYARPRSFANAFALAAFVDKEIAAISRLVTALRARPAVALRVAAAGLIVVAALYLPGRVQAAGKAGVTSTATAAPVPSLVRAGFDLPPLGAYAAAFDSQGAYPTAASNGAVEWVVALRNTGSAGWHLGIDGAQASLVASDGTVVAVQSTPYVGPGQVGWFVARFRAPGEPGSHVIRFRPAISGRGVLADIGLYAVVTVPPAR